MNIMGDGASVAIRVLVLPNFSRITYLIALVFFYVVSDTSSGGLCGQKRPIDLF